MDTMNRIVSFILTIHGFFVFLIERINRVSLGKYKTHLIKKKNPGINHVGGSTYWNNINNLVIGKGTYINGASLITSGNSKICIGEDCLISYEVVIRTDMHVFKDDKTPINKQGISSKDVVIGNNVWIGHGVYIMPGITIGDNSIIGAKAVVTKSIPANSIAVGVPARVVKDR